MTSRHNILVTGANGLLGRQAVAALSGTHHVHALVRALPTDPVADVTYHAVDLSGDWREADLPAGIDTIFHLAQSAHFRDFPAQARDVFQVNIASTARLLDYAQRTGVRRFVYASSGGVYGSGVQAFHENSPIVSHGQLGYYLGSKLCSEILAENYAALMTVVTLRFFFMYGRGQKRSMLLPRLVDSVREGRPITLQGAGGIRINPVHVGDACRALGKAALLEESRTFNIAGPEVFSLREIAELIGELVGRAPVFAESAGTPGDLVAGIEAMREKLCIPTVTLRQGLADLL